MSDRTYLHCAHCGMVFNDSKPVDLIERQDKIGDLHVCGGCLKISEVCLLDPGTRLLSPEDYEALDEQTKRDLSFAAKAIVDKLKKQ